MERREGEERGRVLKLCMTASALEAVAGGGELHRGDRGGLFVISLRDTGHENRFWKGDGDGFIFAWSLNKALLVCGTSQVGVTQSDGAEKLDVVWRGCRDKLLRDTELLGRE